MHMRMGACPNACCNIARRGNMFKTLLDSLANLTASERGVTAIEYALIAALIAVVIITAVSSMGTGVSSTFSTVAGEL